MLATLVDEPFNDREWLYEVKWDGFRAVAYLDDGKVRLVSRNQNELTGNYIQYDMRRELAEVQGAPPGATPPPNSRVKVTIIPAKKEGASAKGAAPAATPSTPPPALKQDTETGTK